MATDRTPAYRAFQAYLARAKQMARGHDDILEAIMDIERSAAVLLEVPAEQEMPPRVTSAARNPRHFQANGIHLSNEGREHLYGLYDRGFSVRGAAAEMGITIGPAGHHRVNWIRRRAGSEHIPLDVSS